MKKCVSFLQKRSFVLSLLVLLTLSLGSALGKYVYRGTAATISLSVKAEEPKGKVYDLFYKNNGFYADPQGTFGVKIVEAAGERYLDLVDEGQPTQVTKFSQLSYTENGAESYVKTLDVNDQLTDVYSVWMGSQYTFSSNETVEGKYTIRRLGEGTGVSAYTNILLNVTSGNIKINLDIDGTANLIGSIPAAVYLNQSGEKVSATIASTGNNWNNLALSINSGNVELGESCNIQNNASSGRNCGVSVSQGATLTVRGNVIYNKGSMFGGIQTSGTANIYGTVSNNKATSTAATGGGILVQNGTLNVYNTGVVRDNYSAGHGGGIHCAPTRSTTDTIRATINGTVSGNTAEKNGGGICLSETTNVSKGVTATINGTVSGNSANGNGGGVYLLGTNPNSEISATLYYNTVSENVAGANGGGVYMEGTYATLDTYCTFSKNSAANGGGLYMNKGKLNTIRATEFLGNSATLDGGGIFIQGTRFAEFYYGEITYGSIKNNTAGQDGGGICFKDTSGNYLRVGDVTISYNTAAGNGGGIYTDQSLYVSEKWINGEATYTTITYNSANNGGGIYVGGNPDYICLCYGELSYNQATEYGGGICYADTVTKKPEIKGSYHRFTRIPIEYNKAGVEGGGIYMGSSFMHNVLDQKIRNNEIWAETTGTHNFTSDGKVYCDIYDNGADTHTCKPEDHYVTSGQASGNMSTRTWGLNVSQISPAA